MRKQIYETVHLYEGNVLSVIYKYFMILVIAISFIPLTSKESNEIFLLIDKVCLVVYVVDYILRMITADYKFQKMHWTSFVRYPFRIISIIDLLSIFALFASVTNWIGVFRIAGALKIFRIVRVFRYSKSLQTILSVLQKTKKSMMAVGTLAIGYILISAIIVFNVEPDTFKTFFDAIYWATVSLTTVGYGDIYPVSVLGRTIAMFSSFFGIAIVALPAGVVTAGFMSEIEDEK